MDKLKGLYLKIDMLDETFFRSPMTCIVSRRHRPVAVASIMLADADGEIYKRFRPEQPVTIEYGYRDDPKALWSGWTASQKAVAKDQIEIKCVGADRPVIRSEIKLMWSDEAPDAIIRHAIRLAGLTPGRVDAPPGVSMIPKFIVDSLSLWQVHLQCVHTLKRAFGADMRKWALWMDVEKDVVNWGDFDRDGIKPVIETGSNLIRHDTATDQKGLYQVETFLLAGFQHSRLFRLLDVRRSIDKTVRALTVRHVLGDHVRTFIEYGDEYDQL